MFKDKDMLPQDSLSEMLSKSPGMSQLSLKGTFMSVSRKKCGF